MTTYPWGRGVLVYSGGADSTVLLYHLKRMSLVKMAVFFDYGQASARQQLQHVTDHCNDLSVELLQVKLPMPTQVGGVYERSFVPQVTDDADGNVELEGEELLEWRRKQWSWIEARNALFLTWAAGLAADRKLSRVYVGFQEENEEASRDEDIDTRLPFVEALNAALAFGSLSRPVRIVAPFLEMGLNKNAIADLGRTLRVPLERTYSCEFWPQCGVCGQCKRRDRAIG